MAFPTAGTSKPTKNPDGTINCGSRAEYEVEVGRKRHCRIGFRVLSKVRNYFGRHGIVEGDRFRVHVLNPRTARRVRFRCEVLGVGRYGSQTWCERKRTFVNISSYVIQG